jgi:hypothetical protein
MAVLPCGLDATPAASEIFSSTTAPLLECPLYSSTCTPSGQTARTTRARCPVKKTIRTIRILRLIWDQLKLRAFLILAKRCRQINRVLRYKSKYNRMIDDFITDRNGGKMLKAMAKIYDPSY